MDFGVWYDLRRDPQGTEPYSRHYAECLEEIVFAESLGFRQVWFSEHHLVDDGYLPSQLIAAAHVAAKTTTIELGTNVFLLPLYHPLRVAEDVAVLDLLSQGRFILGVGGGYVDFEFEAFGVNRRHRPSLMEEGIAVIRQAWETGRVGFQGKRWQFDDLPFSPQPERRIPIWMGADADVAIQRAGRLADGFMTGSAYLRTAAAMYEPWSNAVRTSGRDPADLPFMISAWLYLDEDRDRAWQTMAPLIAYQQNRYAEWGTDRGQPAPKKLTASDLRHEDFPLIGTPEQVLGELKTLHEAVPYTHLCFWARLAGLSHRQALSSIELFARSVMPAFDEVRRANRPTR